MKRHRTVLAVLTLAAVAVPLTHAELSSDASPVVADRSDPVAPPVQSEPAPASLMTALPMPPAGKEPTAGYIAYPDGSRLPPLNGVDVAPPMSFTAASPFTPVVARERDVLGREWYRHENGAFSTTLVDGKGVPLAMICMPMRTPKGR